MFSSSTVETLAPLLFPSRCVESFFVSLFAFHEHPVGYFRCRSACYLTCLDNRIILSRFTAQFTTGDRHGEVSIVPQLSNEEEWSPSSDMDISVADSQGDVDTDEAGPIFSRRSSSALNIFDLDVDYRGGSIYLQPDREDHPSEDHTHREFSRESVLQVSKVTV